MGSGIACHFANIGVEVLLLDICPKELNEIEVKQNLSLESKKVKNRIVNDMFQKCIKSRPSPIYNKKFLDRIKLGNFEDDIHKINEVDWIIEVVVEKLDIKKSQYHKDKIPSWWWTNSFNRLEGRKTYWSIRPKKGWHSPWVLRQLTYQTY